MLSHGDELGRTQLGNNNAYCHDGPLTWIDWNLDPSDQELLEFTRAVLAVRAANPLLRRPTFFTHAPAGPEHPLDLTWLRADGREMGAAEWEDPANHVLGMLIRGKGKAGTDPGGPSWEGLSTLLLLNGGGRSKIFTLPAMAGPGVWSELIGTARPAHETVLDNFNLAPHSLVLLAYQTTLPPAHR
jgi:glycogen operon protein